MKPLTEILCCFNLIFLRAEKSYFQSYFDNLAKDSYTYYACSVILA
uniref:Uncharacterized protein n=1 Tax=virus sp. ctLpa4 TaxID=2825814 RepID=A0A8S5RM59_9VIRU|nr:MAG TPA: hypothetical protein [virus sp. ctLpa4]